MLKNGGGSYQACDNASDHRGVPSDTPESPWLRCKKSKFRTFSPSFNGAKLYMERGRRRSDGADHLLVTAAQARTVSVWHCMWLIMNPALPVQTVMMTTCMMCILCYVWCHSVIYSCSLCTISQQVLNSTVMTCFQDQIRNKSLQLRGHNQRVQTEELSRSGTSPAKSPFTHRAAGGTRDVMKLRSSVG